MSQETVFNVLLAPHISEKGSQGAGEYRQYVFKVTKQATKPQIKRAVEQMFEVAVRSVQIVNVKSKPARFRRTLGRHKAWKKAYVSLQAGQEIDTAGANG